MIDFKPFQIQDRPVYDRYLMDCGERGCEYSFINLYLWGRQQATIQNDRLLFFSQFNRRSVYLFPIGPGDTKTAIDAILKTIANLDARLKKLEGDGGTSTDPTPGDDGSGTIKDDEEKPKDDGKTIQRQFKKEQRAKIIKDAYDRLASIPASKRKLSDYPWYQQQMRLYSGYSHTGSPISKSSNIN